MTKKGKAPVLVPLGYSFKEFLWRSVFAIIIVGSLLFIASRLHLKSQRNTESSEKSPQ